MSVNGDNTINISRSKIKELQTLLETIKMKRRIYIEKETIMKNILIEITQDSSSGTNSLLNQKIRDILLRRELLNCLKIDETNEITLLDINTFLNLDLTFEEQKLCRNIFEQKLQEKEDLLLHEINEISDVKIQDTQEIIQHFKYNSSEENGKIILEEEKLRELHNSLIKSTLELGDKIISLLNLRNDLVPKVMAEKNEHLMLETEKLNLRLRIIELKSQISFFNDSPMSLQAYRLAYKDLKEQQTYYSRKIDEIRSDLEKFKILLRNKEYEEILQNYKQYVCSIEKLKWLNNEVLKK